MTNRDFWRPGQWLRGTGLIVPENRDIYVTLSGIRSEDFITAPIVIQYNFVLNFVLN